MEVTIHKGVIGREDAFVIKPGPFVYGPLPSFTDILPRHGGGRISKGVAKFSGIGTTRNVSTQTLSTCHDIVFPLHLLCWIPQSAQYCDSKRMHLLLQSGGTTGRVAVTYRFSHSTSIQGSNSPVWRAGNHAETVPGNLTSGTRLAPSPQMPHPFLSSQLSCRHLARTCLTILERCS